jgi:hypothetical protein
MAGELAVPVPVWLVVVEVADAGTPGELVVFVVPVGLLGLVVAVLP